MEENKELRKITQEELNEIIESHERWVKDRKQGEQAIFNKMDLSGMDLSCRNLTEAIIINCKLERTNFYDANLTDCKFYCSDFNLANLFSANFKNAKLDGAKNINKAFYDEHTAFFALQCPEEGSFIGYKKARYNKIVKLLIPEDAKRSSATSRKCRCNKAKVLSITNIEGTEKDFVEIASGYDENFIYRVGETVEVPNFNENRWEECTSGIHFFMTRREAVLYW